MEAIMRKVFVNIPFTMLWETYLDVFIHYGLNPEIGMDYKALNNFSMADFKKAAHRLEEHHLRVTFHGPFMDLSPGSIDGDIRAVTRKRFEQLLRLIPVFKPQTIVCHAGYDRRHYSWYREEWIEATLDMWTWFADRVNDAGSRLMLENVYEDGPEDIEALFEELAPHKVGFCFDIGHHVVFGKASMDSWLDSLGPYLGQVHLHDNRGDWDDHLALGLGTIDFAPFWAFLKESKRPLPVITLEPHEEEDLWPSFTELEKTGLFNH